MLLVGFESYMVNEQGLSQGTIRGRMFMIHRYLKACAENAIIDMFSSYAAEEFLKFLRLKKKIFETFSSICDLLLTRIF